MEEFIKELSKQDSGFSITRKNKVIHLTMGEVTDSFFHHLDLMGNHAVMEACLLSGKQLTDEQLLTLREEITVHILEMIEDKMERIALELF